MLSRVFDQRYPINTPSPVKVSGVSRRNEAVYNGIDGNNPKGKDANFKQTVIDQISPTCNHGFPIISILRTTSP